VRRRWIKGSACVATIVAVGVGCLPLAANGEVRPSASGETTLRGTAASFPDYMDPQLSYTSEGWEAMYDTYIPLLTYRHVGGRAGSEVIPGLARHLPRITDGGRTYTLFLRKGLRYSNGQSVKASDFRFTIARMFKVNSGGAPFYLGIVGAERLWYTLGGGVRGIATNNRTGKIVIHLVKPQGTFTQELALPFAALVPPNTPARDQTSDPPPATGPYVITSSEPGRGWSLARNPEWASNNAKRMPRLPDGHFDKIQVDVVRNPEKQVNEIEQGKYDWMQNPPPVDRISEVKRRYEGTQFRVEPTLSTYYFWMNTTKPPFNDLNVRRAVNHAVDPIALERIYAGQVVPTQQILPPGMPGYRKLNLYPHNLAKAKAMIREAHPSDMSITVWTDTESPNDEAGEYYESVLKELGFHTKLKEINADNYFTVIGNRSTPNLDTGWSNWFEDYPHPNDFFQPLLAGESIFRTYNGNFAQIDVPTLNSETSKLRRKPLGPKQEAAYSALDRQYMELAPWVPYGTRALPTFVSKSIDLDKVVWNPTFGADLASFQPK
jgi:peptide/nickel transport system substrate-binding protein